MGKQIRFYFDDRDEREFLGLPQFQNVAFLKFREMATTECEEYQELDRKAHSATLRDQTCICLKDDLDLIIIVGEIDNYFIDVHDSPVIEFTRSGYLPKKNLIVSGRLWYQHKYWTKDETGDDVLLEKSKEIEKLYNSLARWIRKHCTLLPNTNYIASHALELYKRDVELSP
jgi:hypothetical protein